MKIQKQQGFTLIEMVMVIVVIGILSAVAIPKFADMSVDARMAAANGAAGALMSASSIAHSEALVKSTTTGPIFLEGQSITLVYGYPDLASMALAANLTGYDTSKAGFIGVLNAPTPANCGVNYSEATAFSPPSITTDTSGC